jgi:hypothetical protein
MFAELHDGMLTIDTCRLRRPKRRAPRALRPASGAAACRACPSRPA